MSLKVGTAGTEQNIFRLPKLRKWRIIKETDKLGRIVNLQVSA